MRRGEKRADERPGETGAAELLEDEHGVREPEPEVAAQREHAGLDELLPESGVVAARQLLQREPGVQQVADAPLELALLVGRQEVHQRSLGSPRMRSPTML